MYRDAFMLGHGQAAIPRIDFPDFGGLFDQVFSFAHDDTESVVKVIELHDLEKQDIDVSQNGDLITVQGEYSSEIDATRIFEQFVVPKGKQVKTTQFIKNSGGNKLVILFEDRDTEFLNKTETQIV